MTITCAVVIAAALFWLPLYAADQAALSWRDCLLEASRNHPELISAAEAVKESQSAQKISASSAYPQVSASAGAEVAKNSGRATTESYSASLSASQLLFDGRKTVNSVRSAQESVQAATYNFRYASSQVRKSLRSAFVRLLKAQEMVRIAEEIFAIRRQNYELITLRYQSGLEHKGALLTAEANLAQAQYAIETAASDLRVRKRALLKELGREQWEDICVNGEFTIRDTAAGPVDLEELAAGHPQVLKAAAQVNASNFNLKSLYGEYLPEISLSAAAGKSGDSLPLDSEDKNLGVSVSIPLFEGGLRSARIAQARAQLNQLKQSQRSARDSVLVTLEQARASLRQAIDNVAVKEKSLLAAQERSRISEAQYAIGTITFDNWTIIEDNLVSAKENYVNAQADALLAEADWVMAKGETFEQIQ